GKVAAPRHRGRAEFPLGGDLVAERERVHLRRADGRHYRRAEPRAEGRLQGAADDRSRWHVAGELLDRSAGILTGTLQSTLLPTAFSAKSSTARFPRRSSTKTIACWRSTTSTRRHRCMCWWCRSAISGRSAI